MNLKKLCSLHQKGLNDLSYFAFFEETLSCVILCACLTQAIRLEKLVGLPSTVCTTENLGAFHKSAVYVLGSTTKLSSNVIRKIYVQYVLYNTLFSDYSKNGVKAFQ